VKPNAAFAGKLSLRGKCFVQKYDKKNVAKISKVENLIRKIVSGSPSWK